MNKILLNQCIKDYKIMAGLPPYDGPSNYCRGDGYFAMEIESKYPEDVKEEAHRIVSALEAEWNFQRQVFTAR